jgi:hypothetical protein
LDNGSISYYANNLPKFNYKDGGHSSHLQYAPDRQRWKNLYRRRPGARAAPARTR